MHNLFYEHFKIIILARVKKQCTHKLKSLKPLLDVVDK